MSDRGNEKRVITVVAFAALAVILALEFRAVSAAFKHQTSPGHVRPTLMSTLLYSRSR
jgi:hypothetical protein